MTAYGLMYLGPYMHIYHKVMDQLFKGRNDIYTVIQKAASQPQLQSCNSATLQTRCLSGQIHSQQLPAKKGEDTPPESLGTQLFHPGPIGHVQPAQEVSYPWHHRDRYAGFIWSLRRGFGLQARPGGGVFSFLGGQLLGVNLAQLLGVYLASEQRESIWPRGAACLKGLPNYNFAVTAVILPVVMINAVHGQLTGSPWIHLPYPSMYFPLCTLSRSKVCFITSKVLAPYSTRKGTSPICWSQPRIPIQDLEAFGDRLLVKIQTVEEKTSGGILLPSTAQSKPQGGEVVAVGEGKTVGDKKMELGVKTGDSIVYSKYAGTEVEFNGVDHLLLKEDDVFALLSSEDIKDLLPLNDRVLIKIEEPEEKSAGGVLLTDSAKEKPVIGTVVAVGPGVIGEDGTRKALELSAGNSVLYSKYAGNDIKSEDGTQYVVMRATDVLAVLS